MHNDSDNELAMDREKPPAGRGVPEPDVAACDAALRCLLHWIPPEQRQRAYAFLLADLESLYIAAGQRLPLYIPVLRTWPPELGFTA